MNSVHEFKKDNDIYINNTFNVNRWVEFKKGVPFEKVKLNCE